MSDTCRIAVNMDVLVQHLSATDGEIWTLERVAEYLADAGMIHVAGDQRLADDVSLGALSPSAYRVINRAGEQHQSKCCPSCGYDLTANTSERCPGCGERV
jgi:hypothetical protein